MIASNTIFRYTPGVLIAVLCMVMTMCSSSNGFKDALTVTTKEHNTEIKLKKGQLFNIKLESQMSTGFAWKIVSRDAQIEPVGEYEFVPKSKRKKMMVGGVDYQVFHMRAREAGKGAVTLHYVRAWEKVPPARVFIIRYEVAETP